MPLILPLKGISPTIHPSAFLAENATIIGDVTIAEGCSIWYSAVLRGDVGAIRIGRNSNVQDLVMIHCTYEYSNSMVGEEVTIGHSAVIHGCEIQDRVLIGMGAIILDKAVIESQVIVAAGSVVLEKMVLESGFLYAGSPARKIKPLTEKQIANFKGTADHYLMYSGWYRK